MQDVRTRMGGLHRLLTGQPAPVPGYTYPPRHLWGDLGQPRLGPSGARRSLTARLLRR